MYIYIYIYIHTYYRRRRQVDKVSGDAHQVAHARGRGGAVPPEPCL